MSKYVITTKLNLPGQEERNDDEDGVDRFLRQLASPALLAALFRNIFSRSVS